MGGFRGAPPSKIRGRAAEEPSMPPSLRRLLLRAPFWATLAGIVLVSVAASVGMLFALNRDGVGIGIGPTFVGFAHDRRRGADPGVGADRRVHRAPAARGGDGAPRGARPGLPRPAHRAPEPAPLHRGGARGHRGRAVVAGRPLAAVLLDLDDFKSSTPPRPPAATAALEAVRLPGGCVMRRRARRRRRAGAARSCAPSCRAPTPRARAQVMQACAPRGRAASRARPAPSAAPPRSASPRWARRLRRPVRARRQGHVPPRGGKNSASCWPKPPERRRGGLRVTRECPALRPFGGGRAGEQSDGQPRSVPPMSFELFPHMNSLRLPPPSGVLQVGASYGQEMQEFLDNGITSGVFVEPLPRPTSTWPTPAGGSRTHRRQHAVQRQGGPAARVPRRQQRRHEQQHPEPAHHLAVHRHVSFRRR